MTGLYPLTALAAVLALAACSGGGDQERSPVDPAVSAALAGPLLTEPDLAALNGAGRALGGSAVASAEIPANLFTDAARDAAKAEASKLVGGNIETVPAVSGSANAAPGETVLLSLRRAFGRSACEGKLGWSARWALFLPASLPVYPRGHVEEAAGTDLDGCNLRGVSFNTPVAASDVLDFYWTQSKKAGLKAEHRADGDAHALVLSKGGLSAVVHVGQGAEKLTRVDILAKGN